MSFFVTSSRLLVMTVGCAVAIANRAGAQGAAATTPSATHLPVCAKGVRIYTDKSQIPVPFDTLRMPPAAGPVMVSSPEEAEAAELAMRGRAGSVGATGVLVTDVTTEENGMQRMSRSVSAVFVRADSAHAQRACK